MAKEKKNTVICKGCGNEVWIGSKMRDGYCHDCYSRGRHLPEEVDSDEWIVDNRQKKRPNAKRKPFTSPPVKKSLSSIHYSLSTIIVCLIAVGIVFGIYMAITHFNRPMTEAGTIDRLRSEKYSTFINLGERIPDVTIPANGSAITAYINSDESYRMKGIFEYAFYDYKDLGREKKARSDIEMSYNSELDVYKFKITNSGDSADTLKQYKITDGTYYIVKENDITYVLHHGGGRRTAIDMYASRAVYNFLTDYLMVNLIKTDFFTNANTTARHLWDGDLYSIPHSDVGDGMTVYGGQHRTELRTYKHKPLCWFDCNRDKKTTVEWQIKVDFYYDNIPKDAPSVADYR